MAATAAPIKPVSVPTSLGAREVVDLGYPVLNLQRLEEPQTSIHQCATKFGSQGVRAIFEKVKNLSLESTYEEINLSDNQIGDEGAKFLAEGLAGNKTLKKLYLARAGIKADGFAHIGALLSNCSSLEEIVLSSNTSDADGLKGAFCDGLAQNKTLKSLYLGVCRLGNAGVEPLLKGPLPSHPALEHLSLTYNRLGATCVSTLNSMLASNKQLQYLDLSGNSLGQEGAEALVAGLQSNKGRLQKLSVAQNVIRFGGARALALFFASKEGSKIEFLDVRHNSVTYQGFTKLLDELGRSMDDDGGWLLLFGERQLFLNAH
jgi:Ran GTPase-activating protein (RanGAP) involved in mRNA processing and transport